MVTGTISAAEKRMAVVKKYEEILGRNKYSQPKRSYAFKKHSDGKYYSDCSSSIALAYKYAGYPFYDNNGSYNPNTVGMYQAKSLQDVPVVIKNGVIQNPEVLQLGDMLLFAGSDNSRKYADCVGHVEMVGKISGSKVTLYGHGSGTPRATEMNAYCKKRYGQKTSTVIGHKGLLKVRRFFVDEGDASIYICRGMEGNAVKQLQLNLLKLGYKLPKYGADADFGGETEAALKLFQQAHGLAVTGVYRAADDKAMQAALGVSAPEEPAEEPAQNTATGDKVIITGGMVNVRSGPGKQYQVLDTAKKGDTYPAVNMEGWKAVDLGSMVGWVSDTYADDVKGG